MNNNKRDKTNMSFVEIEACKIWLFPPKVKDDQKFKDKKS